MSICDGCIHDYVCGLEDNHEEGIVSCADRIPNDVLDNLRAEIQHLSRADSKYNKVWMSDVLALIDKYKAESEVQE